MICIITTFLHESEKWTTTKRANSLMANSNMKRFYTDLLFTNTGWSSSHTAKFPSVTYFYYPFHSRKIFSAWCGGFLHSFLWIYVQEQNPLQTHSFFTFFIFWLRETVPYVVVWGERKLIHFLHFIFNN